MENEMFVSVHANYQGGDGSHRSTSKFSVPAFGAVHQYNLLLDDAAARVRNGFIGWLPPQIPVPTVITPLSNYEKLAEIKRILDACSDGGQAITDVYAVLER